MKNGQLETIQRILEVASEWKSTLGLFALSIIAIGVLIYGLIKANIIPSNKLVNIIYIALGMFFFLSFLPLLIPSVETKTAKKDEAGIQTKTGSTENIPAVKDVNAPKSEGTSMVITGDQNAGIIGDSNSIKIEGR